MSESSRQPTPAAEFSSSSRRRSKRKAVASPLRSSDRAYRASRASELWLTASTAVPAATMRYVTAANRPSASLPWKFCSTSRGRATIQALAEFTNPAGSANRTSGAKAANPNRIAAASDSFSSDRDRRRSTASRTVVETTGWIATAATSDRVAKNVTRNAAAVVALRTIVERATKSSR